MNSNPFEQKITLALSICLLVSTCLITSSSGQEVAREKLPTSTPLTRMIRLEKFDEAKKLITSENVNQPDKGGYHPLSYAAYTANNEIIEALLKAGANPNVVETNGKTALYITANMANVRGIELLHQYKAKLPPKNALSPGVAAVHSSSLDALKALLTNYPDVNLQDGWENRSKEGKILTDTPGDPIAYAAYNGYDDIAVYLLAKGIRPIGEDYQKKNALHHAAINPHCSANLVKLLIEYGCSPVGKTNEVGSRSLIFNFVPRTPIDFAAISGDMDKVKVLALNIDTKKNIDEIQSAAYIAAAYRHDLISQFLLSLINQKQSTYLNSIGLKKNDLSQESAKETSMDENELSRIMPRTHTRPGEMPRSGSLAIISEPQLEDSVALLSVEFSKQDGVQLLERNEIDKIIAEQGLRGFKNQDSQMLHKSLNLIPAEHVVVMSRHEVNKKTYVRLAVINSASGLVVAMHALPVDILSKENAIKDIFDAVMLSLNDNSKSGIAVSITTITSESNDQSAVSMTQDINTLLPHLVANSNGISSLNRDQMQHLQREKAIGVEGSYWAAAWVIDGGIIKIKDGKTELSLRAIHAITKNEVKATRPIQIDHLDEGLRECWNELVGKMLGDSAQKTNALVDKDSLEKEAQVLYRHARWLYEASYYQEASKLIHACLELSKPDQDRIKLALMTQLKIVYFLAREKNSTTYYTNADCPIRINHAPIYGQLGAYGNIYSSQYRSYSHELRLKLLDSIDDYIRLGELIQTSMLMNPKHESIDGWTLMSEYDGNISTTLYPFVTNSLCELLFFATILDHSMILSDPDIQSAYKAISDQIENITTTYLSHLENLNEGRTNLSSERIKLFTLEYILTKNDDFYSLHYPELFERMMILTRKTISKTTNSGRFNLLSLLRLSARKSISSRETGLTEASKSWILTQQLCAEIGKKNILLGLDSVLPVYQQTERSARVEWFRYICELPFCVIWRYGPSTEMEFHSIGNLVGMDERNQYEVTSISAESALLADLDKLKGTAEYLRLGPFYRTIDHLRRFSENDLLLFLKSRPELKKGALDHDSPVMWNKDAWNSIRSVVYNPNKYGPQIKDVFDTLCEEKSETALSDVAIQLTNDDMVVLPNQKGQEDRIFYSIYQRSAIYKDELWLPGSYVKEHADWKDTGLNSDNAIQVISLKDRSVKTIILPRITTENEDLGTLLIHATERERNGRVVITDNYAYYTTNRKNLFCIRRDNFQVTEIKIPDSFKSLSLNLMDSYADKDLLLVVASEWSPLENSLHQILLIKGDSIAEVLTSNRRKPSKSPMDEPNLQPNLVNFHEDSVWIANSIWSGNGYKYSGYAYNLNTLEWGKLNEQNATDTRALITHKFNADYFLNDPAKFCSTYTSYPRGLKFGYVDYYAYDNDNYYSDAPDVFMKQTRGTINVSVSSINHPFFQKHSFPRALATNPNEKGATILWPNNPYKDRYKGWWSSPNEAIQKGLYKANIIGKWNNFYLMGLNCVNLDGDNKSVSGFAEESGVQAFWMVPGPIFDAALTPVKNRCSRVINFSSIKKFTQFKDTATVSFISNQKDFQWKEYYPIVMSGGGSILAIDPAIEIKNMNLVISVSRLKNSKLFSFRFEVGDEKNPNVIFDSKQHDIGTSNNNASDAALHIPLPDGANRIRLVNDSPKDCRLVIRKLMFMDK